MNKKLQIETFKYHFKPSLKKIKKPKVRFNQQQQHASGIFPQNQFNRFPRVSTRKGYVIISRVLNNTSYVIQTTQERTCRFKLVGMRKDQE